MNILIIILQQTKSEATIEILILLLIAAIIGFVTAWFYYKFVYGNKIIASESERNNLKTYIDNLNIDLNNLSKNLIEKNIEIKQLTMEVSALKAIHTEAAIETGDVSIKNTSTGQKNYEKDEAIINIAQRKHLLNYMSFGTATKDDMDDLKMISGIGPFIEERLHELDIYTFMQIGNFTAQDIDTINNAIEYFSGRIERDEWVAQARELEYSKDKRSELLKRIRQRKVNIYYHRIGIARIEEADDLTIITGIGGWIKEKLNVLDIFTFRQISNFTKEDVQIVTDAIEYFPGRIERDEWILQARELVRIAGKKAELLKNIRERKGRIYFERLGTTNKYNANNLTLIKGIGLWIEERLNLLDIYTFEQISKLTTADVETITEILEISPGRIEKDNWVAQARAFAKKQEYEEINHK